MSNKLKELSQFRFKIEQPALEQILKSIDCFAEEVTIKLDKNGLKFETMDPSHVALISGELPHSMFEIYEVDRDVKFGIVVDEILKIVKDFDRTESIEIKLLPNAKSIQLSRKEVKYKVRILERSDPIDIPKPKLDFNASISLDSETGVSQFTKYLKKILTVSPHITINTTKQKGFFRGSGDMGEVTIDFERGMDWLDDVSSKTKKAESTYSLEYLNPYIKTISKLKTRFDYDTQNPIRIRSEISKVGRLDFYLAPRVDT